MGPFGKGWNSHLQFQKHSRFCWAGGPRSQGDLCCNFHAEHAQPSHAPPEHRRGRDAAFHRYVITLPFYLNADDGKLSFEEFKNYFSDGILSSEELWELFSGIDRRHSE